ncbi:ABC transporter permease [Nocardia amikacinitolerans]|uniref:ABC-2 type transport system permease protein n=1 Tax=Nocardia amikacinitolerans TaxID=756689 RepID=A0A285L9F5_9NOCA|nr:ABC transporter permease [Nocardia amikacinitolerans]MCP2277381.1 ABC-2 type transport system permease protein [Nocardia amikacinitolerans]MCP2291569.1 ABC-2 type transport system permease protein [Nocardia amikacinitolerans]MCP2300147.1 ABC-2 type transport system permease protein [Nocardia amikacinitolerans]SNY81494.1 ABC-2 type transport system permease protein [Nocardia amikacinitolerans]
MGVLAAERIKLTSTRSPWWCAALTVVFALGITALFSLLLNVSMNAYQDDPTIAPEPPYAENVMAGLGITGVSFIPGFGYILIMILAALAVTSEYRFGTIKATFLAAPHRSTVLVTKASMIAVGAAVLSAILTFLSFLILKALTDSDVGSKLSLTDGDLKVFYAVPIFAALVVFLSVGVGALVRQSAGALSLLIVWPVLIEPIIGAFGKYGRNIQVFLPFQNANRFLGLEDTGLPWHWGAWPALLYFAAFVAIVFGAALVVVNKRDA